MVPGHLLGGTLFNMTPVINGTTEGIGVISPCDVLLLPTRDVYQCIMKLLVGMITGKGSLH